VQTRASLCGVDLETGKQLWSQDIPTFRGMNILTPTLFGDSVFTSTYGGTTQLINVSAAGSNFRLEQQWNLPVQGYMSSPVIVNDHAYVHLRNQRYACFDLKNGVEKWRSKPYGKYASLIASGDKILVLDASGDLLLLRANPEKFDVIDSRKVGTDSWAHVALSGKDIVVRNLKDVTLFRATK
jgi:outer membrane protein assembly factor BamB